MLKSIFKQSYTERVPPGLVGFFNCLDTGFFSGLNFLNSEHRVDKLMMCSPVFYPVFYTSYSAFIFHFCGLCERTFPPRNVHKSRPRSPIWYLFSLSQGCNDYPITQIPIIFPSPLSELLNLHHSHATYNLVLFVCWTYICPFAQQVILTGHKIFFFLVKIFNPKTVKSQIQGGIYSVKLSFCGWLTLFSNGVCTSDHQRVTRVRPAQGLFRGGEAILKIVENSGGVETMLWMGIMFLHV